MSTYLIGYMLADILQVEADSAEEAEEVVRAMVPSSLLESAEFEVTYIEHAVSQEVQA